MYCLRFGFCVVNGDRKKKLKVVYIDNINAVTQNSSTLCIRNQLRRYALPVVCKLRQNQSFFFLFFFKSIYKLCQERKLNVTLTVTKTTKYIVRRSTELCVA